MKGIKQLLYTLSIVIITSCWWSIFSIDWGDYHVAKLMPTMIAALGSIGFFVKILLWITDNWNKE